VVVSEAVEEQDMAHKRRVLVRTLAQEHLYQAAQEQPIAGHHDISLYAGKGIATGV
jgi:hypothetical protein